MSRLLQAYIIGWAFVLGMRAPVGTEWQFHALHNIVPLWLFYSVPCVLIFAFGFIVRASHDD